MNILKKVIVLKYWITIFVIDKFPICSNQTDIKWVCFQFIQEWSKRVMVDSRLHHFQWYMNRMTLDLLSLYVPMCVRCERLDWSKQGMSFFRTSDLNIAIELRRSINISSVWKVVVGWETIFHPQARTNAFEFCRDWRKD